MITVITICRNALPDLRCTVDSVQRMKHSAFEFFVVDGNSTDGTKDFLKSLKDYSWGNVQYCYVSEKDGGIYDAMNKGVKLASGDYIIFMNAGDLFYDENVVANFYNEIRSQYADAYYGSTLMHFYEGTGLFDEDEGSKVNPTMPFIHQSVIVRRNLLLEHPFQLEYKVCADHEFFFWMRKSAKIFKRCNFTVSCYDAREGMSENNPLQIAYEHDKIYGRDKRPFYWIRRLILRFTKGLIQPIKDYAPRCLLNIYFRNKKKHIKWVD